MNKHHFSHQYHSMAVIMLILFSMTLMAQFDDQIAVFIVADVTAMNEAENEIAIRLEDMGFELETAGQDAVTDASVEGVALVLISATVTSGTIIANLPGLADLQVPVINWEPFIYDAIGYQALDGGEFNTTEIEIVLDTHLLAAGFPNGLLTITTVEKGVSYGVPEGDAAIIAVNPGDSTQAVLFGYETGSQMAAGTAPARRVGSFLLNDVADAMTEEGWALFDASIIWAMGADISTLAENAGPGNPEHFDLSDNYPNPFNPVTQIQYQIPVSAHVRINIFNTSGKRVTMLVDHIKPAGIHRVAFDASGMSAGIYIYQLETGSYTASKKMTLIK